MIPDYWLPRPEFELSDEVRLELNHLYTAHIESGQGDWLSAPLPVPRWVLLNWLADEKGLLMHGSGDPDITLFEPRTPDDRSPDEFSKQTAVFAAGDGIWSIFYAIIDRHRYPLRMMNGVVQFKISGHYAPIRHFFSLTGTALKREPWREGAVYVLPRTGFERNVPFELGGRVSLEPQYANPEHVAPLAKVHVSPADFPFLRHIRGHDDEEVAMKAAEDPHGFPWLE